MSRIEAGTFDPKLAPVDLGVVVRRVCDAVSTTADEGFSGARRRTWNTDLDLIADEKQIERGACTISCRTR